MNDEEFNEFLLETRYVSDMYENAIENKQKINSLDKTKSLKFSDLEYAIPFSSDLYYDSSNEESLKITKSGIDSATKYATKYANNPNPNYIEFSADCTNFASQILLAIGKGYRYEGSSNGWWYYTNNDTYGTKWVRADEFSNYWGVDGYFTGGWAGVRINAQTGDFLVADWDNGVWGGPDGEWDHLAYVAQTKTINGTKELLIAQHSNNYLRWTNEYNNGWKQEAANGARIGIISLTRNGL